MNRTKYCAHCDAHHPVTDFGLNRQSADGLHYYCRKAAAERRKAWVKANPERAQAIRAAYLAKVHARNEGRNPYE